VRLPFVVTVSGLLWVAVPAEGQNPQVTPLDTTVRVGEDRYFESYLTMLGCTGLKLPAGAAPAAWSGALRTAAAPLLANMLGRISPTPAGNRLNLRSLDQENAFGFAELLYQSRSMTNSQSIAYVLTPSRPLGRKPLAIVIHSSGTLPQHAFGVYLDGEGGSSSGNDSTSMIVGVGSALARAGFVVMAPLMGTEPAASRALPWGDIEVPGEILRVTVGRGGVETILLSEIEAAIDYALQQPDVRSDQIYLIGEREGAYLAALTAASDPRVSGVVRLDSPIDYRAFRLTPTGQHNDAGFAHADCTFGDVAQAALLNGRPLLYASTDQSTEEVIRNPFRSAAVVDSLRKLYSAAGNAELLGISVGSPTVAEAQQKVVDWLTQLTGVNASTPKAVIDVPRVPPGYQFPADEVTQRTNLISLFAATAGPSCPTLAPLVLESAAGAPGVQQALRKSMGLTPFKGTAQGTIRSRRVLDSSRGYRLSEVQIAAGRAPPFLALLAEPLGPVASSPAILSANGNDDLGELFGVGLPSQAPYLHGYADALAQRGFVVLVPLVPRWVPDGFGAIAKGQTLGPFPVWKVLMPVLQQALDALIALPGVDAQRVAVTGISFGGTLASLVAAVDLRAQALVFNNIPIDYRKAFDVAGGGYTNVWLADACGVADAALLAVAPRPLIWQAGEDPLVLNEGMDIIARIRNRYRAVGAEDNFTFTRHWGGHEMFPDLLRIFGR
jgi:dienelactone hydrolase